MLREARESAERIKMRHFIIPICEPCVQLEGEMCSTPECPFFLCSMEEVSEYLNQLLIRPIIDGVQVDDICRAEIEARRTP